MKKLVLVRGIPGAGKTTFAKSTGMGVVLSADDYFVNPKTRKYEFDADKLGAAHNYCQAETAACMHEGWGTIYVANTFTTEKEMKPYYELAKKYGYTVFSIIVENRHDGISEHDVPLETIEKMKNRFNIKL